MISLTRVRVAEKRLVCTVQLQGNCPHKTTKALMDAVISQRPSLSRHACVNGRGPTFAAVMNNTPLIHVLEHLIIDFQTELCPNEKALFVGTSQWVSEPEGTGCVEVSFQDDLQALEAVQKALGLLNQVLRQQA